MGDADNSFTIKVKDIPDQLKEDVYHSLSHSSIPLGYTDKLGTENIITCGSGTLVKSGNVYGVLTAAHVIKALKEHKYSIIFPGKGHGFFDFPENTLDFSVSGKSDCPENGPDIGFIRIPDNKVGSLKAKKTFVDLDTQKEKIKNKDFNPQEGVWCMVGFPEGKIKTEMESENRLFMQLYNFCGFGNAENFVQRGDYDYFDSGIDLYTEYIDFDDFGGMSGCGVWRIFFNQKMEVVDKHLFGVGYYQTNIDKNERHIKCHGHKSIYENVLPNFVNK